MADESDNHVAWCTHARNFMYNFLCSTSLMQDAHISLHHHPEIAGVQLAASQKVLVVQTVWHLQISPNKQVTKRKTRCCNNTELPNNHLIRSYFQPKTSINIVQNQLLQRHGTDQ